MVLGSGSMFFVYSFPQTLSPLGMQKRFLSQSLSSARSLFEDVCHEMISASVVLMHETEDRDDRIQTAYYGSEEHLPFKYVQSTDLQVQNEDVVWGEGETE